MRKYIKKPVVIEAIKWDGNNTDEVLAFTGENAKFVSEESENILLVGTLESNDKVGTRHAASVGDFIIKGIQGEFYPCKPDIFAQTYDLYEE